MIAAAAAWLIGKGVSAKLAKPLIFFGLFIAVAALLAGAKCAYDRSIIKAHDAERDAATAKADRKADTKAAEERRSDDARLTTETQEIKDAVDEAKRTGADPRAAYYACVRLQQSARARGEPPPNC